MKNRWFLTVVLTLELLLITACAQSKREVSNDALLGLKNIIVVIDEVETTSYPVGSHPDTLTAADVKTDVEGRLRRAGFNVIDAKQQGQQVNTPSLHVTLTSQTDERGTNYFHFSLQLFEEVTLQRNHPTKVPAVTWQTGETGLGGGYKFFPSIVCEGVSHFIWETINANGSKRPEGALLEELGCGP